MKSNIIRCSISIILVLLSTDTNGETLESHKVQESFKAQQDYCRFGRGTVLVLVDRTSVYDQFDIDRFRQGIVDVVSSLPPGDRLVINTIADSYTRSRKIFDSCLPGCPEGKFLDWLFGSCLPVLARMDGQNFRKELVQRLRDLLKATESYPNSDIARTIAEVTKIYNMSSNMKTIHTLVIVSDMIENSDVVPHQSIFSERSDKIIRRFSQAGIEVNLQGAEVQVLGVGRDDTPERRPLGPEVRRKLKEIWTSWLKMGGASSVKFK